MAQCVSEFGYDAAANYHMLDPARLAALCPRGIDVFFDNTSGGISAASFDVPQFQTILLRGIAWAGKHPVDELLTPAHNAKP